MTAYPPSSETQHTTDPLASIKSEKIGKTKGNINQGNK